MKIGDNVVFKFGGKSVTGRITGKHGEADYYAVYVNETRETVYLWGADMAPADMGRVFKDSESGAVVSAWDLLEWYNEGVSEAETFGQYVANCQSYKGGTLDEIRGFQIVKGFARWRVLYYGAGNYDGVYCRDWRELKEVDTIEEAARYIGGLL